MDFSKYGFVCHDDYLHFVRWAEESGRIDTGALPGAQCLELDEGTESFPTKSAGDADAQVIVLCKEVSQLYGTARLRDDLQEGDDAEGEMSGWHHRFLSVAYPVGQTYSGDLILQGTESGEIYFSNHETWAETQFINSPDADERSELEEEIEDAMAELDLETVDGLSAPQVLKLMTHDSLDALTRIADDFEHLLAILAMARRR